MNYILYGTSACHLCEEAEAIIQRLQPSSSFNLEKIDIAVDDGLIEQYGLSIPVLYCKETKQSLQWPFDETKADEFLRLNQTNRQ
jgi:hypothetical protein